MYGVYPHQQFINANGEALPFKDKEFDYVICNQVLEHAENPADDEHYFQVMLPSATSLAKGKKMVLMNTLNTKELGRSLIACS